MGVYLHPASMMNYRGNHRFKPLAAGVKRGRAFHDLDFCMSLATIDGNQKLRTRAAPYERFATTMLNRLRRFLGQPT